MAENGPVLGADCAWLLYVENKKLSRDFVNVKSGSAKDENYEGVDEHLNKEDVEPWQRYKMTKGSVELEPDNLGYVWTVRNAIQVVQRAGKKPDIKLVRRVRNGDGSTSEESYKKVVLTFGDDSKERGTRVPVTIDWTGVRIFQ